MRGKPNVYAAKPITLWGQVVHYEVTVNNVPVATVISERKELRVVEKRTTLKLNKDKLREVCNG